MPESKLVLGKHSGRHALNERCEDLGFTLSQEELDDVYHRFTALADRKKGLMDEEIAALVRESRTGYSCAAVGGRLKINGPKRIWFCPATASAPKSRAKPCASWSTSRRSSITS